MKNTDLKLGKANLVDMRNETFEISSTIPLVKLIPWSKSTDETKMIPLFYFITKKKKKIVCFGNKSVCIGSKGFILSPVICDQIWRSL